MLFGWEMWSTERAILQTEQTEMEEKKFGMVVFFIKNWMIQKRNYASSIMTVRMLCIIMRRTSLIQKWMPGTRRIANKVVGGLKMQGIYSVITLCGNARF